MKKKIVLANDSVDIDLTVIVEFLNSVSSYFIFEQYIDEIKIDDSIITPDTYNNLGVSADSETNFFMIFTDRKYHNNFFNDSPGNTILTSFFAWEYLTTLSKNNGAVYFIVSLIADDIDDSFLHAINDGGKPECIYDFLINKSAIDSSMRSALICPECNQRIKKKIKSDNDKAAFEDLKTIMNHIGNASKWDEDLVVYWSKMKKSSGVQVTKNNLFISYSNQDIEWLKRVKVHLKPLERNSIINIWADTRIRTGDKWKQEIERALEESHVAVLLISADFLASEFIMENELPPLLKKAESEGTRIFPILISPSSYERIDQISQFQAVNSPSKTLIEMNRGEQERLLVKLADDIISHMQGN